MTVKEQIMAKAEITDDDVAGDWSRCFEGSQGGIMFISVPNAVSNVNARLLPLIAALAELATSAGHAFSPGVDRDCDACDLGITEAPCSCWDYLGACRETREALSKLKAVLEENREFVMPEGK